RKGGICASALPCEGELAGRASYSSKKGRHLRDGAFVAAAGYHDLANPQVARGVLDASVGNEYRRGAQVAASGRAEDRKEVRQAPAARDRHRLPPPRLPSCQKPACVRLGPAAPIAFRVFDARAAPFERAAQPLAAALTAEQHDGTAVQILQFIERCQG